LTVDKIVTLDKHMSCLLADQGQRDIQPSESRAAMMRHMRPRVI
jgi:hypothetical protein